MFLPPTAAFTAPAAPNPPNPQPLLLTPIEIAPGLTLPNRCVMAPLTRMRADPRTLAPTPLNAQMYAQRAATAGLVIGEATFVSPDGYGYLNSPGICTPEQVAGHRLITDAVHQAHGKIFLQLWHVGRVSHPLLQPGGALPVAPSAVMPATGQVHFTPQGPQPFVTPRALTTEEIRTHLVPSFRRGAENAKAAGYDGVEIHAANGYIIEQFLSDHVNLRTDEYGGSIENRCRLLKEIVEAVIDVFGASRVGVRLSPASSFNDIHFTDRHADFAYVIQQLNEYSLAYLHIVEPRVEGSRDKDESDSSGSGSDGIDWSLGTPHWRRLWRGCLIGAGGYTRRGAEAAVRKGDVDLVAFGRWFISNPDMPVRFAAAFRAEEGDGGDVVNDVDKGFLIPYDRSTFYGGDARGYTDYPTLTEQETGDGGGQLLN